MVSEDTNHFHQGLVQDVRRVSREIQEAGVPKYPHELVGIEIFVTEGLARRVEVARREHIRAVLYEQMLQRQQGIYDPAKLSSVSMKTDWLKERARTIAIGHWLQDIFVK